MSMIFRAGEWEQQIQPLSWGVHKYITIRISILLVLQHQFGKGLFYTKHTVTVEHAALDKNHNSTSRE